MLEQPNDTILYRRIYLCGLGARATFEQVEKIIQFYNYTMGRFGVTLGVRIYAALQYPSLQSPL